MDLLKVPNFPYRKRFHNKGQLSLATEVLKGFSKGVSNKFYVTHRKTIKTNIKNGKVNWEHLEARKTTVVHSDSWWKAKHLPALWLI